MSICVYNIFIEMKEIDVLLNINNIKSVFDSFLYQFLKKQ